MKSEILDFDNLLTICLVLLSLTGHLWKEDAHKLEETLVIKPQSSSSHLYIPTKRADTQNLLFISSRDKKIHNINSH
jgi:hypothetical protein